MDAYNLSIIQFSNDGIYILGLLRYNNVRSNK